MERPHTHRAVERVDRILDFVARAAEPPTLSAVTVGLGLPRSTAADLLRELTTRGWLERTGHCYRVGRRLQVLALLAGLDPPVPLDHGELESLSRVARTPLALAVLVGAEVLYLDAAGPRAPERLQEVADRRRPRPALRTAAGRLLLACAPDRDREVVLRTVDDAPAVAAFERDRSAIRHAGVARSDGLADPTVRAVAIGVRRGTGTVAAVVLFGPRPHRVDGTAPWSDLALDGAAARVTAALRHQESSSARDG